MVSIVTFEGGLGNQLFQYAFYRVLRKRYKKESWLFDISGSTYCHNGFEIFKVFYIHGKNRYRIFNILKYKLKYKFSCFCCVQQKSPRKYDSTLLNNPGKFNIYKGYWQSEKWFANIIDDIRELYKFKEDKVNAKTRLLANEIKSGRNVYCSVHIRRGDYLLIQRFGILNIDYYNNAVNIIKSKISSDVIFCIFSDDQDWCKQHLQMKGIFVDWNSGVDAWQDMYLMSLCQHNIIANSTFSWWGAWLNKNPCKIVIAPKQWFLDSTDYDILPGSWLKV